jgi:hypothetical protein
MTNPTTPEYRYWAFISYSSKDTAHAKWLHRAIETYGIPAKLVEHGHLTPAGDPVPARFQPLFRDRDELPVSADLGKALEDALAASRYLIVVCSPNAAQSRWVNREIETFVEMGRGDRVFAYIADGEPNGGGERECFPPALKAQEPLAADARQQSDGRSDARLKLLAGMLGVSFDALKQRESQRRIRRLQLVIAAAVILTLAFGGLAWYANQARGRALVAEGNAVAEAHVRATAESNAVGEAQARATAQAYAEDRQRAAEHEATLSLTRQLAAKADGEQGTEEGLLIAATAARIALDSAITDTGAVYGTLATSLAAGPVKFIRHGAGDADQAEFSPDGSRMATSGYDRWVRLWDTETGTQLAAFPRSGPPFPYYGSVKAGVYAFSPDGSRLAIQDREDILHLVEADGGREIWQDQLAGQALALSFDLPGRRMAVLDGSVLVQFHDG